MSGVLRGFCLLRRSEECRLIFRHTYGDFSGTREGWKPEQPANTAPIKTARRLLADCSLIARALNPSNRRAPWSGQTRAAGGSHRQFPRKFGEILVGFEPASTDLAKNSGLCRHLGEGGPKLPETPRRESDRSTVATHCYRLTAVRIPSDGEFRARISRITKNATEPNSATYRRSQSWQKTIQKFHTPAPAPKYVVRVNNYTVRVTNRYKAK